MEKAILLATTLLLALEPRTSVAQPSVTLPDTGTVITGAQHTVSGKSLDVYLSIPYARPPTSERRFKDPEPMTSLPSHINATQFPPPCYQRYFNPDDHVNKNMSEDCLYLNIWVPSKHGSNMAVLIHIYGGSFEYGSTDLFENNPQYLAARTNTVVVSLNYRISSFGFIDLQTKSSNGNMGLKDQILALTWVNQYIKVFGGDPKKVTLYGLSAGSISIALLLSNKDHKNLFQGVFLQSGTSNSGYLNIYKSGEQNALDRYHEVLNCDPKSPELLQCLQSKSAADIIEADNAAVSVNNHEAFGPKLDGKLISFTSIKDFFKKNIIFNKDIIIGTTKDEGSLAQAVTKTYFIENNSTKIEALEYTLNLIGQNNSGFIKIANNYFRNVPEYDFDKYGLAVKELVEDFLFRCPIFYFANIMASRNNNVFFYYFTYQTRYKAKNESTRVFGAAHGEDQQYVLGLPQRDSLPYTQKEIQFSNRMMDYLGDFAKFGQPEPLHWPRYQHGPHTPPYSTDRSPHLLAELNANYYRLINLPKKRRCETLWRRFYYPNSS